MKKEIIWRLYRDDTKRSLPQKLAVLVELYKNKVGQVPTVIGLPPVMKGYELLDELRERFVVEFAVPSWAEDEIWLGVGLSTQSTQRNTKEIEDG